MAEVRMVKDKNGILRPQKIADFYLPDTMEGRSELQRLMDNKSIPDGMHIHFCGEFKPTVDGRNCELRQVAYMDGQNKCRRCPAGYLFEVMTDNIPDEERMQMDSEKEDTDPLGVGEENYGD